MEITPFTKGDFQNLNQTDRIEFLIRKNDIIHNIKKSLPIFEVLVIFLVGAYSRLYTLTLFAAFEISNETLILVKSSTLFFNAVIVLFVISFITRVIIYFRKHKQLNDLHEEFLDKIYVERLGNEITQKSKKVKNEGIRSN